MLDDKIKQIFNNYPDTSSMKQLKDALLDQIHLFVNHELREGKTLQEAELKAEKNLKGLNKFIQQVNQQENDTLDKVELNKFLAKTFGLKLVNEFKIPLSGIDELHFNYRLGDLLIWPSPNQDHLIVRDFMSRDIAKLYSTIEKVGNVIKITQGPKKLVGLFKNKIIILLPTNYTGFLTIRSQSGSVTFNHLDQKCLLDITDISGNVILRNSNIDRLQADSKSGDISLLNSKINDCHVNIHSGNIMINNTQIHPTNGELSLSSTSGKINLTNISTKRLLINSKSGNIVGQNVTASLTEIATDSGNIKLDNFISAGQFDTKSGKIKLTLPASFDRDLKINSHSGNVKILTSENFEFQFLLTVKSGNIDLPMDAILYAEDNYDQFKGYVGSENTKCQLDITTKTGKINISNKSTKKREL